MTLLQEQVKQSKLSSIDDVEIVHASLASKTVTKRVQPKVAIAAERLSKDSFRIHGSCIRFLELVDSWPQKLKSHFESCITIKLTSP